MSTIRADDVAPSAGGTSRSLVRGVVAAWVNFNGTGTIAARSSVNVSSLTDNGTGDYTVNFSNAFGAVDYVANCGHGDSADGGDVYCIIAIWPSSTASSFRSYAYTGAFGFLADSVYGNYSFHGDLA